MKPVMMAFFVLSFLAAKPNVPSIIVDGGQLLKALAYDEQHVPPNIYDWRLSPNSQKMIAWDPEGNKWTDNGFERKGIIVLSNQGKVTHHRIDQKVKPGYWTLRLFAKTSAPTFVSLTPSNVTQEGPHIDLDVVNIQEKVVCRDERSVTETGYRMKFPGKKPFWLDEVTKRSPKGSASSYAITYAQKPQCVIDKLREEEEARRLEEQKRREEAALEKKRREIEALKRKKEELEKIRQANEELKRQQIEQIEQVKKELEGLLDQKINLANMLGAQNAFNYQQSLQLIQNKIAYIKQQKKIAAKIKGVQSNIDLLSKELEAAQTSLKELKKTKANKAKAAYLKQQARLRKRLLAHSRQLLESYREEKQIGETKEMIGQRLTKDPGSSDTYVVKQGNMTRSALVQQEERYRLLHKTVMQKIRKAQQSLHAEEQEIERLQTEMAGTDSNDSKFAQKQGTLKIKQQMLQQTRELIESYQNKQKEYEEILARVEQTKQALARKPHPSGEQYNRPPAVSAPGTPPATEKVSPQQRSNTPLESYLREYLASGTGRITRDLVRRFFGRRVRPYYSIASADREDIYQDKVKYSRRWPERDYWLTKYHVVDRYSMGGRDYIEVIMTLGWRVYSPKRGEKRGESTVSMTLDVTNGERKITALRRARIRRAVPERTAPVVIRDNGKRSITLDDEGVHIEVEYPAKVWAGEMFTLTARMTNRTGRTARQGGLTLSFPDIMRLDGTVRRGNFHSVQGYSYPDQIYSNTTHSKMTAEYFMVEGWHKYKWRRGTTKYFTVSLRAPGGLSRLRINVRGILWIRNKYDTRQAPRNSLIRDQQGFPVRQFVIDVE